MLKQAVLRGGAHSGPVSLRCGARLQPFSAMARNFSQTAAALQEPAGDAAADKVLNREERLSKMENFVRKHWKEGGSLPTPYVLMKEFGGARTTANKVLSRIEEELKSNNTAAQSEAGSSSSAENSQKPKAIVDEEATIKPVAVTETRASNSLTDSQGFASDGTKVAVSTDGTKAAVSTDGTKAAVSTDGLITPKVPVASRTSTFEAKSASITTKISSNGASMQVDKEQGKSDGKTDLKGTAEPGVSLWKRLHNIAYGNPSSPTPSPVTKPTTGMAPRVMKDLLSSSEDDSESDSESDGDMNFPEPDGDKNPAQPLFRSDLQQRHGLYIKFLSPQATESDVRGAFRSCGDIHRVQVVRGRNPSAKYIYAFVDFTTEESLKVALKKEVVIRGSKVLTETANRAAREKPQKQESESDGESADPSKSKANLVPTTAVQKTNNLKAAASQDATSESGLSRCTIAIENIPQSSLPQIVEALSQYGDIASSRTKVSPGGNTTAFVEFKNECDKDNALSASKVLLAGKTLKMTRLDSPLTTVVRLSNIPPDARDKVASSYKSYGQVDKVDTRMEGVLDIYYSGSELKNMARILDKLNCLHMSKKKLRAIPAPISYPKSLAETAESPVGLKWIESQRELVTKNLESSLKKAAMYSQDLQELLKLQPQVPDPQGKSVAASN